MKKIFKVFSVFIIISVLISTFFPNKASLAATPNFVAIDVSSLSGVIEVQIDNQTTTVNGVEADLTVKNPLNLWQQLDVLNSSGINISGKSWVDDTFLGANLIPPDIELHFHAVFTDENQVLTFQESNGLGWSTAFNLVYILLELVPGVKAATSSNWALALNDIKALINILELTEAKQDLVDIFSGNISLTELPHKVISLADNLWGAFSRVSIETKTQMLANILADLGIPNAQSQASSLVTKLGNVFTILNLCRTIADEIVLVWTTWETGGVSKASVYSGFQPGGINPPSTPSIIYPTNNIIVSSNRPTFEWTPVENATQYIIEISSTPDFKVLNGIYRTSESTFNLPTDLIGSRMYFWKVLALNQAGISSYSSPGQFQTPSYISSPNLPYDSAYFTGYETIPDRSIVSPGEVLVKTWRVRNSGTSTWDSYKLKFINGNQMSGPSEITIPKTAPGQTVDLSINITAPLSFGYHKGTWQIVNREGNWVSGGQVWVIIKVETQSNNITLIADPPSPANTNSVRIFARVSNFPNFRAMRVKIDGNVEYELGAPEFYFDWNTSNYSAGDHSIVVEVADQTDTSWSRPQQRGIIYTLSGNTDPSNHAPNRPILVANPAYDWYVTIGNAPQLCAQEQGDPEGDPVTQYRFVATASVGTVDSGWVSGSCHSFGSITPGTYEWNAQVKDNKGGISDWSDKWHFTVEPPGVDAYIDHFSPASPSNAEEVRIYACSTGHAGVNITLRVLVNDANDGSDSGEWHIIKEQGSPCFNDLDVPIWRTLEYGDGLHLVRVVAMAIQPDAGDVYDQVYELTHRRPDSPRLVAPVPTSGIITEPIYLNSQTISFQWGQTIRAESYTLHVSTDPSPKDDPNPVFRQTFDSNTTEHTITFSQDYPALYWQVEATNDVGSNFSGAQLFGIDLQNPSCTVSNLTSPTYESVFQVNWSGSDNLADIRSFDIQFMDSDRGTWEDWLTAVPSEKAYELFMGQPGHSYFFRCRATDNANSTGDYPASADTSMTVDPSARPPTPWWDTSYSQKRNLTILNNMPGTSLEAGYPIHLHFDSNTTPTATELYDASLSNPKCNDLRIVASDAIEVNRVVQNCSPSAIDIWFRSQVSIPGGTSDNTTHQLYYGNASAGSPPNNPNQVWYPYLEAGTTYLYFFQEGSGSTAYDSSGNSRNCSIDASVQWATSKFGYGLRFNRANFGDSRSLNCGSAIPLTAFTIEFWYKPDADDGGRIAGELAGGGNGGGGNNWLLQNFEGTIRLDTWECPTCGSQEVRSNFNLRDFPYLGNWNHIAVTFNGGNEVKFYINGTLDSTKYLQDSGINTFTPPLEIGSAEGIGQVKGNLGAFRISSGVKSSFPYGAFGNITNEPMTAVGDVVSPPITGSPDLVVLSVNTYPNPDGGVLVEAVVQNQGDLETQNGFYTDLYVDHLPTGAGDYTGSLRLWVNDPIPPDAIVTLTTVVTDLGQVAGISALTATATGETSGTLYAQTDSMGLVGEPDDQNNIFSSGTPICLASPDAFESDETFSSASDLSLGSVQTHNFDRPGDQDWVKFTARAGLTYRLTTSNLGTSADTFIYLYDTDGVTLLASNDDFGSSLASQLDWTAPASGTYYLLIKHWNPNVGGCGTGYDIGLSEVVTNNPPNVPSSPSPADGAVDQDLNVSLSWSGGDPDTGDAVTYDVYLDVNDPPVALICDDVTNAACTPPGSLQFFTDYYWKVVATDSQSTSTEGPVWHFRTRKDVLFADGFESGNLSAWSSSVVDGGDLSVSAAAALVGSFGMQAVIDDNLALYVTDDTPLAEPRYRARFYFDPNSIPMVSGNAHYILYGYSGTSTVVLRVEFRYSGGSYQLRAGQFTDSATWRTTSWFSIADSPHFLEVDWRAATAAGANNGGLTLWIDGVQKANLTGTDNDTRRIDRVRLGAVAGIDSGTRGTYYFDAFESQRNDYIGPASVFADFTSAPTNGAAPLSVSFTNLSQSPTPITGYLWDFGDGATSTDTNPVHIYTAEGSYTVTLTATSGSEQSTSTKTNYITVADLIFADGFESGNLSAWTSCITDAGDLSVTNAAALVGSYGMRAVIDDNISIYCSDDKPTAEPRYRARFYFDPNSIPMVSGDNHFLFYGYSGASTLVLRIQFRSSNGSYQIRVSMLDDGTTWKSTSYFTISDGPHSVEFDWRAANGPGANDGGLTLWIDGVQKADLTGVDNDIRRIDVVRFGAVAGVDTGTRGTYYFDKLESRRQSYIGP